MWWDETKSSVVLAELAVYFESYFAEAAKRKAAHLIEQLQTSDYSATHITLEIGSEGVPSLKTLASCCDMSAKELLQNVIRVTIQGSFSIWCFRNTQT